MSWALAVGPNGRSGALHGRERSTWSSAAPTVTSPSVAAQES